MFEFDPAKSAANKAKHGIDFEEAQALWDGITVTVPSAQGHHDERRHLVIGTIAGRRWTAIVTKRDAKIRIISVRRARDFEELHHEQAQQSRDGSEN